ncbi:hypothetical protein [uncultured Nocardioides sp.]|uniref:hypothetical protein n=1 Tax=uncultured Nocardioides sp. TaxID=198441 RepID=UPI0026193527|nr:hypothetical protein [uncultured Nocardioides sp.]
MTSNRTTTPPDDACLLCGTSEGLTVEHIIPQTLWKRFGIDPDRDDLAQYRTVLCNRHNQATSALHGRAEVMDLIEHGEPRDPKTLVLLADWAVWVTLLLGLARGSGVLGASASRALLLERFDGVRGGGPKGVRVYAALVSEYVEASGEARSQFALALVGDSRVVLDPAGEPVGLSFRLGPVNASEAIGLGKVALLVVGRTHSSGPDHLKRLDAAAADVGLSRIWPPDSSVPELVEQQVSITDVSRLFTVMPFSSDMSLMPPGIRALGG